MLTTLPVVAPLGTAATILVPLQLLTVAAVILNLTVLVPCVVPKFVPVIVTDVPTGPDVGDRLVMLGPVLPPAPAARNAAKAAPQVSDPPSEALADAVPAIACTPSSASNFVFGAPGTLSSLAYPLPAVKFAGLAVMMAPSNKSPFAVVLTFPLFGFALLPCAAPATSSDPPVAIPEYSRIAKRIVAEIVSDTVIVFAPPAMFSA
jgi:hypothetical protein